MRFLAEAHAPKVRHSGRSFLEHLVGTHNLLRQWGNPEHVCLAGLFHSIYGTDRFKYSLLLPNELSRQKLRQLIGTRAEQLAFHFCSFCREDLFSLRIDEMLKEGTAVLMGGSQEHMDLLEIEVANFLEQRLYLVKNGQHPRAYFRIRKNLPRWRAYLMPLPDSLSGSAARELNQFFYEAEKMLSKGPEGDPDLLLRRHRVPIQLEPQ